jgi:K+-transporting ATPase ATPase C chain
MKREVITALRMTVATLVLTGIVYPLAITALAQGLFRHRANGSIVTAEGRAVGSELIGQTFKRLDYFQGRPSAAGSDGYDASASSGSNLGPTSAKLRDRVAAEIKRLQDENPQAPGPLPIELVTTSGSGLDPHLSSEATHWQASRVAASRGVSRADVEALIEERIEGRTLGFLGEPRVNVLLLNLELDKRFPRAGREPRMLSHERHEP